MSDLDVKAISLIGLEYQRTRLEAAALNIANAQVFSSSASTAFSPVTATSINKSMSFSNYLQQGTEVQLVSNQNLAAKAVLKPSHPLADDKGYVYLPNINVANEMITLNSATRAYEANVKAFNAYKEMSAKAIEIGR